MVKKTMNQMTLLAALRRSESPFPVSNSEQKIRNSIWRMITFFLGGEPSIQLRYEDILDFPLFSRLCRDGQENHESNDSARRTSALWIPLSRFERRTNNAKFNLAHDNIFLRRWTLYPTELQKPVLHIIKALRGKHKRNRPFEASYLHAFASTWSSA